MAGALASASAAYTAKPSIASARPDAAQPKMYGVFESQRLDLAAEAGFQYVEKDLWVTPGHKSLKELPQADQDNFREYTSQARDNGQQVILNLWQVGWPVKGSQYTPPDRPHQWRDMCDVGIDAIQVEQNDAKAAGQDPSISGIVIGVEPNARYFWKNQTNPGMSYENWLSTCYTRIKSRLPNIQVYGGALASHADSGGTGPGTFIAQMCAAYDKNHSTGPIMDGFDMHSYETDPPETSHPNTDVITVGDYDKLERLLSCFKQGNIPVLWGEIGYQSAIPKYQSYRYSGKETASKLLDETTLGNYYAQTFDIISKQPYAIGGFLFKVMDDPNLSGWQSGLYYANEKSTRRTTGAAPQPDAAKKSLTIVEKKLESLQSDY
jgi:hypothetical protein